MAEKRDALVVQILFVTARGAGGMRVSREASAWLHGRYLPWLTAVKPELGKPPIAVWDEKGTGFLARFKEIGRLARAATAGPELTVEDVYRAALQVEGEAPCPYCPPFPPPAGAALEPPLPEAVFGQIVFALARGAGAVRISLAACGWFHDRYAPWLTAAKPELGVAPLEIWETMGKGFLGKFREIGEGARAIASGGELSPEDLAASAWQVEDESPCPHCPVWPPPPGISAESPAALHVHQGSSQGVLSV